MPRRRRTIASSLIPQSAQLVQDWYQRQAGEAVPVKRLHLTWVPPFYLKQEGEVIAVSSWDGVTQGFSGELGVYSSPAGTILHLKLKPERVLVELAQKIRGAAEPKIDYDLKPYAGGVLPAFEGHISLDYDYPKMTVPNWPNLIGKIDLEAPALWVENEVGEWEKVE